MKYILTIFCFMSVMFSSTVESYYKQLKNLSDTQKIALVEFYVYGQDYGYNEILAADFYYKMGLTYSPIVHDRVINDPYSLLIEILLWLEANTKISV